MQHRPATEPERQAWLSDLRTRLQSWHDQPDVPADWVASQVDDRIAALEHATETAVCALTEGDEPAGMLALLVNTHAGRSEALIADLWISPDQRRQGLGGRSVALAEDWARARQASVIWAVTDPAEPAHAVLFARYPTRSYQMIKELSDPGELADGIEGRTMTETEFADWRAGLVRDYAADITDSGTMNAADALAASAAQTDQILPDGLRTPGHSFLCLCAGGEVVATNWIQHHRTSGVSWVYGVETHEGHRGKGYGRAAMVIGERATLDAGDTHLALNVFGHNDVAIGLYRSMGYRATDAGRSMEL